MSGRRWAAGVALAAVLIVPAGARAAFTPDTLVSGSAYVEADYALDPAISADGHYVTYTASQSGVIGVYRRDLRTRGLELVARGNAGAPSISSDGRYVSFTTTASNPATGAGSQCSSVYVRDMTLAPSAPGAYTLVSALSGGSVGLSYAASGTAGCPGGGSSAAPRVAMSADGRKVAFTVVGGSNLTTGAGGPPTTPGAQVAVRNLDTDTTTLITQTRASIGKAPQPVPGGGAITDDSTGVGPGAGTSNADAGDSTAAISANGSAVAWLGINIPTQAPAAATDGPQGHANEYDEPLWRTLPGSGAPIHRVTGGDDPACGKTPCSGPLDTHWSGPSNPFPGQDQGPERGTLIDYTGFPAVTPITASGLAQATPQLSSNGRVVAFLSTQPATGHDPVYLGSPPIGVSTNVFIVRMWPGLTRTQALRRITAWGSTNFGDVPLAGPIQSLAISPEGDRLAFTTSRTTFPKSPPALITPELSQVAYNQLYVVDLKAGTMELVSTGYDGQPANGTVAAPTFSAANGPIAFASAATNLVYGGLSDVTGGQEIFVTTELHPAAVPGHQTVGTGPRGHGFIPEWKIATRVRHIADGAIAVHVSVPGSGMVLAAATTGSQGGGFDLARAQARARGLGTVTLRLLPSHRYRRLIDRTGGMYAVVRVTFRATGHPRLHAKVAVEFKPSHGGRQ
jgi:hypothetical protein